MTVVGQGLTLPWLIRRLGVIEDGTDEEEHEELKARAGDRARPRSDRVDELEEEEWTQRGRRSSASAALYNFRQRRFKAAGGKPSSDAATDIEERSLAYQRLMHEIYAVQRRRSWCGCATSDGSAPT